MKKKWEYWAYSDTMDFDTLILKVPEGWTHDEIVSTYVNYRDIEGPFKTLKEARDHAREMPLHTILECRTMLSNINQPPQVFDPEGECGPPTGHEAEN